MPEIIKNDDGTEREVYTAEEMAVIQRERDEAVQRSGNIGFEFKQYRQMTDEEKASLSESDKALRQKLDQQDELIAQMRGEMEASKTQTITTTKNAALETLSSGDPTLKAVIEENYKKLSGMPESTPQEVAARMTESYKLATGSAARVAPVNPFNPGSGDAPAIYVPKANKTPIENAEEYVGTPQGKAAWETMQAAKQGQ